MTVSHSFPIFHDPDSLRSTGQIFYRLSLSLGLSDVFVVTRLELRVLGDDYQRGEVPFSYIDRTYH